MSNSNIESKWEKNVIIIILMKLYTTYYCKMYSMIYILLTINLVYSDCVACRCDVMHIV